MSIWSKDRERDWRSWSVSLLLHVSILISLWHTLLPGDDSGGAAGAIDGQLEQAGNEVAAFDRADLVPHVFEPQDDPLQPVGIGAGHEDLAGIDPAGRSEIAHPPLSVAAIGAVGQVAAIDADVPAAREVRGKAGRAVKGKSGAAKEQEPDLTGNLDGRRSEERAKLVKSGGGTKASEEAVELGLLWLARQQRTDGSWNFQYGSNDPGTLDSPMGATGLALLAFLGAGYTHKDGPYKSQVNAGLNFLMANMELNESGGWMRGTGLATMYVQAIGAMALCEAFSMTRDPELQRHAQLSIDFICKAQDPGGGGWRYNIPQSGDLSVTGWQFMALKSAKVAELRVPQKVVVKATKFLKSVESESGARYGYTRAGQVRNTMTAVGLLCRMYLGREQTHHGMIRGIKYLSELGPNPDDMYYSYYATQAMRHWGGSRWEMWNPVMRDSLVSRQSRSGETAGSWATDQSHGALMGGRLYTTCLCIMTLEIYYRYLPLYRSKAVSSDF